MFGVYPNFKHAQVGLNADFLKGCVPRKRETGSKA